MKDKEIRRIISPHFGYRLYVISSSNTAPADKNMLYTMANNRKSVKKRQLIIPVANDKITTTYPIISTTGIIVHNKLIWHGQQADPAVSWVK